MDEAERIAREAHAQSWPSFRWESDSTGDVKCAMTRAARLGIEHGERESAAKIADMKRTLEWYSEGIPGHRAAQCLARNFPAPKPSLREAAQAAADYLGGRTRDALRDAQVRDALRDALAREEGK